jgi:hypothetical protein
MTAIAQKPHGSVAARAEVAGAVETPSGATAEEGVCHVPSTFFGANVTAG